MIARDTAQSSSNVEEPGGVHQAVDASGHGHAKRLRGRPLADRKRAWPGATAAEHRG